MNEIRHDVYLREDSFCYLQAFPLIVYIIF